MMVADFCPKEISREYATKKFQRFADVDRGIINMATLKRAVKELGVDMTEEEFQMLIERTDANNDGQITADDFYNILTNKYFL